MEYQLIKSQNLQQSYLSVIEQILINRGISEKEIFHFLNTTDEDILDPSLIANIHEGVTLLASHILKKDKILIQIDSDCDGFTSAAALLNYLNMLFPGYVQNYISYRIHYGKQHGVIAETVPSDIKLVIAPDSSSNDYEVHKILAERGCDVLVIDHHEAEKVSEYACVINNQLCDYPTKSLSGVGMVYKFCCYFDKIMGTSYASNILDLVAIGMIADMMDLRDFETKHLIFKGLQKENLRNPFILKAIEMQKFSIEKAGGLSPFSVGFYIGPLVNATIRVGSLEEKLTLFESMLDFKATEVIPSTKRGCKGQFEEKVIQACRNCNNIRNRQKKIRDNSAAAIETLIKKRNLTDDKIIAVKLDNLSEAEKNLTGLIANQLMAKYRHPILLLNKNYSVNSERTVTWEGSGRSFEVEGFESLREFLKESNLVYLAEGHANALGVGIEDAKFNEFIEYSNEKLKNYDFNPFYKVDFIWSANRLNPQNIIDIANLNEYKLWGQGIAEPKVAIEKIRINNNNVKLMSPDKSPTLKITLANGVSLIKFESSQEEYELFTSGGEKEIDIVGTCAKNEWFGKVNPQIIIEDYNINNNYFKYNF